MGAEVHPDPSLCCCEIPSDEGTGPEATPWAASLGIALPTPPSTGGAGGLEMPKSREKKGAAHDACPPMVILW